MVFFTLKQRASVADWTRRVPRKHYEVMAWVRIPGFPLLLDYFFLLISHMLPIIFSTNRSSSYYLQFIWFSLKCDLYDNIVLLKHKYKRSRQ